MTLRTAFTPAASRGHRLAQGNRESNPIRKIWRLSRYHYAIPQRCEHHPLAHVLTPSPSSIVFCALFVSQAPTYYPLTQGQVRGAIASTCSATTLRLSVPCFSCVRATSRNRTRVLLFRREKLCPLSYSGLGSSIGYKTHRVLYSHIER